MVDPADDRMGYWIGLVAREMREQRGRLQVQIAAEQRTHQETIRRFETGDHWPRDPDARIAAYAADLDIDPIELWALALERWRAARQDD